MAMARMAILLGAALLSACSPEPPASNVIAADGPAKPFVPLTAEEIRKILPGHYIDEGTPYGCMNAPILILKDGSFDAMTELSGRTGGQYVITDGTIEFDDHGAPEHMVVTLKLFRDQKGRLYYRHEFEHDDPRPATLKPADPKMLDDLCRDGVVANWTAPKP
ncbi:MAG: hypothetical protein ACAH11_15750 [Sphingomonas sp.]